MFGDYLSDCNINLIFPVVISSILHAGLDFVKWPNQIIYMIFAALKNISGSYLYIHGYHN